MLAGFLVGVAVTLGTVAIIRAHRQQWHIRARRQIRALPKARPTKEP